MKYMLLVGLLLVPTVATAQPRRIPMWEECYLDGERMACYAEEDVRELLVAEQDLLRAEETIEALQRQIADMERLWRNALAQLEELESIRLLLTTRNSDLTGQLMEAIEAKNIWRAEAESPDVWPLLGGATLALISVGLVVGMLLADL